MSATHLPSHAPALQNPLSTAESTVPTSTEKPRNGFAGLKHWRHDLAAGLVVSLISLPFSLGIAVASGAPPICGVISAIIAGLVLPFLGGSYRDGQRSGRRAGTDPTGVDDGARPGGSCHRLPASASHHLLGGLRSDRAGQVQDGPVQPPSFPAAVVEGMLAAIGLLIIVKQLPLLIGRQFEAHEFLGDVPRAAAELPHLGPRSVLIGVFCLGDDLRAVACKARWLKVVPPQVLAVGLEPCWAGILGLDGTI